MYLQELINEVVFVFFKSWPQFLTDFYDFWKKHRGDPLFKCQKSRIKILPLWFFLGGGSMYHNRHFGRFLKIEKKMRNCYVKKIFSGQVL